MIFRTKLEVFCVHRRMSGAKDAGLREQSPCGAGIYPARRALLFQPDGFSIGQA